MRCVYVWYMYARMYLTALSVYVSACMRTCASLRLVCMCAHVCAHVPHCVRCVCVHMYARMCLTAFGVYVCKRVRACASLRSVCMCAHVCAHVPHCVRCVCVRMYARMCLTALVLELKSHYHEY